MVGDLEDKSRVGFVLVSLPFNITTRHIWCVYFRLQSLMVVHLHRFLNCWFFSIFFPNCYVLKLLITYSLHYSFMVHIVHNGRFEWKDRSTNNAVNAPHKNKKYRCHKQTNKRNYLVYMCNFCVDLFHIFQYFQQNHTYVSLLLSVHKLNLIVVYFETNLLINLQRKQV